MENTLEEELAEYKDVNGGNNRKHTISSGIRDNRNHGTVGEFLVEHIKPSSNVAIVSAFFTIYAYKKLQSQFDSIKRLRFLFGEPTFIKAIDPEKMDARSYQIEDNKLSIPLANRLSQKATARECSDWINEKVDIRSMVKPNFLHGKMYYIKQESGVEKAITGSSNFTVNGLGLGGSPNIELNMIVDSDRDRADLCAWFDELWNDTTGLVEDVKDQVLHYLEQLYIENSPEFIYYKTLFHIFENYLDDQQRGDLLNERTGFFESEIWNALYDFQKDGVKGAINKILRHNGCIIADSVGLGKTYEALAVIKYFELLNQRVLVICPKKLSGNWTIYQATQNHNLNPFKSDRFSFAVIYHTDMGRESGISGANSIDLANFNWGAYDLVVIDESHNFRGNPTENVKDDGSVRLNRAKWLMDKIIKDGVKTKVLMLSATPVNNTLRDLRNQIAFITEGKDDALFDCCQIKDISFTLKNAQTHFTNWADHKKNPRRTLKQLLEKLDSAFFKLLDELTIARSRKHINTFYKLEAVGNFPERNKPQSVYPEIDLKNRFPSYDRLNKEILKYKLSVFNPSAYIREEYQDQYANVAGTSVLAFTQSDRENFLIGMMKVNFLKRLESSIESFEISLDRTIKKIEDLQKRIQDFIKFKEDTQQTTLDLFTPDESELEENGEDNEQWQVGKKLKFQFAHLYLDRWLKDLQTDKDALVDLWNNAQAVTIDRDAKLHELKTLLKNKQSSGINEGNRKALIFTAFTDTAQYLFDNLMEFCTNELKLNCALISGTVTKTTFGKNDYSSILTNFSPVSKNRSKIKSMQQDQEIDILIATDCISEGQNLQDCDFLINYDIHWNPVRIIQRFGRIDRLGSKNKRIQLVNFWPTKDLDNYINLKERVESRMALVDVTATGEDNILNTEQIEELISEDLKYRNQQLKKLRDEVLDLEDMEETPSLTDFTLDDFRVDLTNFIDGNRKKLAGTPLGLYALVPTPASPETSFSPTIFTASLMDIVKPGVIYCLRQKGDTTGTEEVNPLSPYYLVYVRDDGTVRYNYTNVKQILEIYRILCQGHTAPYEQLCEMFNAETCNGEDMSHYNNILTKAVSEIKQVFRKRQNQKLTTDRGALLIPKSKQIQESDSFELVTWLIIK